MILRPSLHSSGVEVTVLALPRHKKHKKADWQKFNHTVALNAVSFCGATVLLGLLYLGWISQYWNLLLEGRNTEQGGTDREKLS